MPETDQSRVARPSRVFLVNNLVERHVTSRMREYIESWQNVRDASESSHPP